MNWNAVNFCVILILWPLTNVSGQHTALIDALYDQTTSDITELKQQAIQTEIDFWKKNNGISLNLAGRTNGNELLLDNQISLVASAKINILGSGIRQHRLTAETLQLEMALNVSQGDTENINHNHGIYYNYIIATYNNHKIDKARAIVSLAEKWNSTLKNVYHQKAIEQSALGQSQRTIGLYEQMISTHITFNEIFEHLNKGITLTINSQMALPELDFKRMAAEVAKDSIASNIVYLKNQIARKKIKQANLSNLSATAGYDVWRQRPIAGISYSVPLSKIPSKSVGHELDIEIERILMDRAQSIKELSNYQYEYDYKVKQIIDLRYKISAIEELIQTYEKQERILDVSYVHDINQAKTQIAELEYEWIDLEQQATLVLLQIKKQIYPRKLSNYEIGKHTYDNSIYEHQRYVVIEPGHYISPDDKDFIRDNELHIIDDIAAIENAILLYPSRYDHRADLENTIENIPTTVHIVFPNLSVLKDLEMKTIKNHMKASLDQ